MAEKKTILITGASSGIGKACAELLAQEGYDLVLVSRNESKFIDFIKVYNEVKIHVVECDLSDPLNVKKIFDYLKLNCIKLDGMVYASGETLTFPIKNTKVEQYEHLMNLNFLSFVESVKYFLKKDFSNTKSSVVVLSSSASLGNPVALSAYSASKSAVNSFVKTSAKESIKRLIRINAIAPGYVDTNMTKKAFENSENSIDELIKKEQPFGIIPVVQIASLVRFLLSNESEYITGSVIPVSGGDIY